MQHETHREDGFPAYYARNTKSWRSYLKAHHATDQNVWLILYKKDSGVESINPSDAIDEALCFGWIDSKPNKRDDKSYYLFFARRNEKSNWSGVNKEKIVKLDKAGKLAPAGKEMVRIAKATGTWDALNDVENLVVPPDLEAIFNTFPAVARNNWDNFPPSVRRGILEWIFNAKRAATRAKRIQETASRAANNERANQWR